MKRLLLVSVMILCLILLSSCTVISILAVNSGDSHDASQDFWGSYTAEKTYVHSQTAQLQRVGHQISSSFSQL